MISRELIAFRNAAAGLRAELHFGKLDGAWDLDRAADLVRSIGDECDALIFALQKVVGADVIRSAEPFGDVAGEIAFGLERKRDADAREAREAYDPPSWSPTLEKFV